MHRRESYYRIPTDPAVTGLAGAVLPAGLDVLSAAAAGITRLRLLDDALRQDVPGCEGWRWDAGEFRAETFSPFFDPAAYLVAAGRASGEYAGLVRIWRNRAGPRLGLIAMLARYRRRGVARALLGRAFAVLAARGAASVAGEVDDTNVASLSLLTGLGARRYGGNVELIRRQPGRPARDRPEERGPSAGRQGRADPARLSRRAARGDALSPRTRTADLRGTLLPADRRADTPRFRDQDAHTLE